MPSYHASMGGSKATLAIAFLTNILVSAAAVATPRDGLVLWLDAEQPLGNGKAPGETGPLDQWFDLSDMGNHVSQDEADRRPVWTRNGLNGQPTVRFRGSDLLDLSGVQGLAAGDQVFHIVILFSAPKGGPPAQRLLDLNSRTGPQASPEDRRGFWVGFQQQRYIPRLGIHNGDEGEARSAAWDAKPHLLELIYAGEHRFEIHVDGRREQRSMFRGTHFLGFQKHITLALGQHFGLESNAGTWLQGDISQVMIYSRTLSTTERIGIANRLGTKYDFTTEFDTLPVFEKDIRPLFDKHCFECHGADTQEESLDLRTVSAMLQGGEAGPVIVRGHPEQSELMAVLDSRKMPPEPGEPLTENELDLIRRWIEGDSPAEEAARPQRPPAKFTADDRRHWAWQPLQSISPPNVANPDLAANSIDRFLLAKLEKNRLSYSSEASDEQIVRRLFFDLVGIPPTPSEVESYQRDRRPLRLERLVDRLMASPQFGERWGRHWLDVAGYVDMVGSDNDAAIIKPLEGKWRYRDYVIRSFNHDMPFNRFLVEQLAGDELHDWRNAEEFTTEMLNALTATGFLLSANDDTDQNELNTPDVRHHVLQRTSENVANTLFAVTLQCAKCHDHKYESLSQVDYYRFEAIFAPVFNVRNWQVSTARTRPDVSNKLAADIERVNGQADAQLKTLDQRHAAIRAACREKIFTTKLSAISEPDRDALRLAIATADEKKSKEQKQLVVEHGAKVAVTDSEIDEALTEEQKAEIAQIDKERHLAIQRRRSFSRISVADETDSPAWTHVLRRGDWMRPGLEVQPELFEIFTDAGEPYHMRAVSASGSTGGRLALAEAVTDAKRLPGQHVSRVYVNRVWQQLFGTGIVETSDNFGVSGAAPSHPELLDWLAAEFIRNEWRPKRLIKQIVLSRAYRQATAAASDHPGMSADPNNRLVWRMNLRRLDSEQLRDSVLAVSGSLDETVGGPPMPLDPLPSGMVVQKLTGLPPGTSPYRRSVYLLARRNYHLTFMRVFDQPIVARTCTVRKPSAMVTQSLALLHDEFMLEQSSRLADRVRRELPSGTPRQRIEFAWKLVFGRAPELDETELCLATWQRHVKRLSNAEPAGGEGESAGGESTSGESADRMAFAQICHMLLNTNEFLYLE